VTPKAGMGFRPDINSLRALAVLGVLAFHFDVWPFAGGFSGVDVFFVISGYLMTSIILRRIELESFSVIGFYMDRAQRILPALIVLLTVMLGFGAVFFLPDEYIVLSKHVGTSVAFLSNILYWREGGYFDGSAETKWLLHTWSLSVEWQFYLLYPLALTMARRFSRRLLVFTMLAGAALSFALAVYLSNIAPRAGFFLLPSRVWEMLAGGLIYLAPSLRARGAAHARAAQWAGIGLILCTMLLARSGSWPGVWTLVPVVGTALVIAAGDTESWIVNNRVVSWLGLNSYSIYLWHWPIMVLLVRSGHKGEGPYVAGGLALSLLIGHLSYRYVERQAGPARDVPRGHARPITGTRWTSGSIVVPVILIAGASVGIWSSRGLPERFSAEVQAVDADVAPGGPYTAGCFSQNGVPDLCIVGTHTERAVATMLGDSHAESEISALVAALPANAQGGVAFNAYASCPPILGAQSDTLDGQCGAFNERFLRPQTEKRSTPLILTAYWTEYVSHPSIPFAGAGDVPSAEQFQSHLFRSSCILAAAGPTYIVLPTPVFPFPVGLELQRRLIRDPASADITLPLETYLRQRNRIVPTLKAVATQCGVKLLDPLPYLCSNGVCSGSLRHRAIFSDAHHLSEYGNKLLVPMYSSIFLDSRQIPLSPSTL
jgi:peptidoglycan/LPS O-acetylase OafA/YrhL